MKKTAVITILILILLGGVGYFFLNLSQKSASHYKSVLPTPTKQLSPTTTQPSSTQTPTQSISISYCTPQNLEALLALDYAAGNVYGTFTLQNISKQSCQVAGGTFISAQYDTNTVKNITISHIGQTQAQPFILAPGQTLYSQVHYPNGPQCQSIGLTTTNVTFTYVISPQQIVTFKNQEGSTTQQIETCKSSTDMTEIQIWNISTQPITQ